ncbi:MAG: hypothetical protein IPO45_05525 [Saprospiraceae bacterium]|nr:hypothetical protein [Candidatus Brachybacter algidus]
MAEGIENIIISLYSRGMSNSDIENQIGIYTMKYQLQRFQNNKCYNRGYWHGKIGRWKMSI